MNIKQIFCCHNDEEIDRYYIEQHEHIPFVRFVMPVFYLFCTYRCKKCGRKKIRNAGRYQSRDTFTKIGYQNAVKELNRRGFYKKEQE